MNIGYHMNTLVPNMVKSDGPLTVCDCTDKNIRREQRKCISYGEGKKGYCTFYRSSIGACTNYDGCFSPKKN